MAKFIVCGRVSKDGGADLPIGFNIRIVNAPNETAAKDRYRYYWQCEGYKVLESIANEEIGPINE